VAEVWESSPMKSLELSELDLRLERVKEEELLLDSISTPSDGGLIMKFAR
jgi:hypothetical protein